MNELLRNPPLLPIALMSGAALVVGFLALQTPEPSPAPNLDGLFSFSPIDLTEAETQRGELLESARPLIKGENSPDALLSARVKIGLAEVANLGAHDPYALEAIHREFLAYASEVRSIYGPGGLVRAGERAWAQFLRGLAALRPAPQTLSLEIGDPETANAALLAHAWRESFIALAYTMDFIPIARIEGFLDEDGRLIREKEPYVHLLFRYLWAELAGASIPLHISMTGAEIIALRRWQMEASSMKPEAKLRLIKRLRRSLIGYDFDRTEAIVRFHAGDIDGAKLALQRGIERATEEGREPGDLPDLLNALEDAR